MCETQINYSARTVGEAVYFVFVINKENVMNRYTATITFDCEPVNRKILKDYIEEAIEHWGGQLSPDDPLFNIENCSARLVKVETVIVNELESE